MTDVGSVSKDMIRQRIVQVATAVLGVVGIALWLAGTTLGMYLAAVAVILFAVATVRWVNDEAAIEEGKVRAGDKK
jgi:uncharacterized membrane protein YidH (DUF202 family)